MFPKLTREELKKEEQRLAQSVKRQLWWGVPMSLCLSGVTLFVANRYLGFQLDISDYIFFLFIWSICSCSDWIALLHTRKKLKQQ